MHQVTKAGQWARGFLYSIIPILTGLQAALGGPQPVNWPLVWVGIALNVANAVRAFIDQSSNSDVPAPVAIEGQTKPVVTEDVEQ